MTTQHEQENPFAGMDELTKRRTAGESLQRAAGTIAEYISPDDAVRLMLAGALYAMLPILGNDGAAAMLRECADEVESDKERLN
ncbi:MAG: hypothetical protein RIA65_14100 [Woeseia sp.]